MAILKSLLNKTRIGEPINTWQDPDLAKDPYEIRNDPYTPSPPPDINDGKPFAGGLIDTNTCHEGFVWDNVQGKCVKIGTVPDEACPKGTHWSTHINKCVSDIQNTPDEPDFIANCPKGQHKDASGKCIDDPIDATKWCESLGKKIPMWQTCPPVGGGGGGGGNNDPTPNPDDIGDYTGGYKEPIGDEGGDKDDWYDRFPIDYDPSRFGDYQGWLKGKYNPKTGEYEGGTDPKEDLFNKLGIELKDDYKDFFGDYSWFEENLAGTEFDVNRKDLTSQLFDLTRGSWGLRQGQGMQSGAPRELERLGMGQVGREFQGMDTQYRKDIFGLRKGFEEDTIDRLLQLMQSGAEPSYMGKDFFDTYSDDFSDFVGNITGNTNITDAYKNTKIKAEFSKYLAGSTDYSYDMWQNLPENTRKAVFRQWYENTYQG